MTNSQNLFILFIEEVRRSVREESATQHFHGRMMELRGLELRQMIDTLTVVHRAYKNLDDAEINRSLTSVCDKHDIPGASNVRSVLVFEKECIAKILLNLIFIDLCDSTMLNGDSILRRISLPRDHHQHQ